VLRVGGFPISERPRKRPASRPEVGVECLAEPIANVLGFHEPVAQPSRGDVETDKSAVGFNFGSMHLGVPSRFTIPRAVSPVMFNSGQPPRLGVRFGTFAFAEEDHTHRVVTMISGRSWVGKYPAVLLFLLSAGCASATPPQPQVAATQPASPQPPATQAPDPAIAAAMPKPAAPQPVASEPAARPVTTPAPQETRAPLTPPSVKTPASPAARKDSAPVKPTPKPVIPAVAASPAAPAATAAPTLDLNALTARLKATKAIGVFTKISLKNKVDDLMQRFAEHYQGKKPPIAELRLSYDLLMMKVLSLLQDEDEALASAVISSREAIWALLADEKSFAALQS
jgi:hypothetical protein